MEQFLHFKKEIFLHCFFLSKETIFFFFKKKYDNTAMVFVNCFPAVSSWRTSVHIFKNVPVPHGDGHEPYLKLLVCRPLLGVQMHRHESCRFGQ